MSTIGREKQEKVEKKLEAKNTADGAESTPLHKEVKIKLFYCCYF